MDNINYLDILRGGADNWNRWREERPDLLPELKDLNLDEQDLAGCNFREAKFINVLMQRADLRNACFDKAFVKDTLLTESIVEGASFRSTNFYRSRLIRVDLRRCTFAPLYFGETMLWDADLSGCDLHLANFSNCDLSRARLESAVLTGASLTGCNLNEVTLRSASLAEADLSRSSLIDADLSDADLTRAKLTGAYLVSASLARANLTEASLQAAVLINTDLEHSSLARSKVYGISTWNIRLTDAQQNDLLITQEDEPAITIDNLEVAQFTYLLLHNEKLRGVIDTITSKAVLLLGRFTPERKHVLDALRDELRRRNYLPIMFDFEKPTERDISETVVTLASMCRFIITDITNPSSNPLELQATVPNFMIPFVPIIKEGERPFAMFRDLYGKYEWVLPPLVYDTPANLIKHLDKAVIEPALEKHRELMIKKARDMPTRSLKDYS